MVAPNNIYISGAACTGKTTLVNELRKHHSRQPETDSDANQPVVISEVARTVLKQLAIDRHDIETSPARSLELQEAILQAQYDAEIAAANAGAWYVSDRCALDPIVYTYLYVGEGVARQLLDSPNWLALEARMKTSLICLCQAGCDWLIDDGVRLMPKDNEDWARFDQRFCNLLDERGIDYIVIPNDLRGIGDRLGLIVDAHERSSAGKGLLQPQS